MRTIILSIFISFLPLLSNSQGAPSLSEICTMISGQWKADSNSCKGERLRLSGFIKKAKPDSITKQFLISTLGKPNIVEKYFMGYPVNKNYVEFIYFIYKDNCPEIQFEGMGIGFVFDETETNFIKTDHHDFCR